MFILYTLVQKSKIATYIDGLWQAGVFGVKVHLACNWLLSSDLYKLRKGVNIEYIAQQTNTKETECLVLV